MSLITKEDEETVVTNCEDGVPRSQAMRKGDEMVGRDSFGVNIYF